MSLSFVLIRRVSRDIQLFQTVKDVKRLNPLVDLLESIESLPKYLYICTEIPPTTTITLIVMKTLVELLHPRTGNQSNPSQWRATRAFFFAESYLTQCILEQYLMKHSGGKYVQQ